MIDLVTMQTEVATLRLELEDARAQVDRLQSELERRRGLEVSRVSDTVSTLQSELMIQVSAPVAQLLAQHHMITVEGRAVAARDVLAVSRRLVQALRDAGLVVCGEVGEKAAFDPELHDPLGDERPASGQPVVVRLPGVSFQGRVLRRLGVVADGGQAPRRPSEA